MPNIRWRVVLPTDPSFNPPVPCNGCTLCCEGGDVIHLHPRMGDDPSQYATVMTDRKDRDGTQLHALAKMEDGKTCVYLDKGVGCTIHERRPIMCRTFDCAAQVKINKKSLREAIRAGVISRQVARRGKKLLADGYRPQLPKREK